MKRNLARLFFLIAIALALASCSGLPGQPGGPPPVSGTATVNITFKDSPPVGVTILSFQVTLSGLTVTSSTGAVTAIRGQATQLLELANLVTDTTQISKTVFNAGNYTKMTIAFANPTVVFLNQTGAAIGLCLNNTVCQLPSISAGSFDVTSSPFPLNLIAGQQINLQIDFDLNQALDASMNVSFPPAVVSAKIINPTAVNGPVGAFDDVLGTISNPNTTANTFTVISPIAIYTASVDATTVFDGFIQTCVANDITCLANNQLVSVELQLNADGTMLAKEIDFLNAPITLSEIEGVVFSVDSPTQFQIVAVEVLQGGFGPAPSVGPILVALTSSPTFKVDAKGLVLPVSAQSLFENATDTSELAPGQRVLIRVASTSGGTGGTPLTFNTDLVRLRYSRITATVTGTFSGNFFDINNLPAIFNTSATLQVQTFPGQTVFESTPNGAITDLANGDSVAIRMLAIPNVAPSFYATKVRKN